MGPAKGKDPQCRQSESTSMEVEGLPKPGV